MPAIHKSVDIKARELGLHINPSGNVHVLPTIASFVGADTSAVILAEEPHKQDENWLLIDVGTNAELVLGNRKRLVCTSTPTGPALEGAHVEYGMRAAPGAIERVHIDEKLSNRNIKSSVKMNGTQARQRESVVPPSSTRWQNCSELRSSILGASSKRS